MSRSIDIIVRANPDVDDCLTDAAETFAAEFRELRGYDLSPRWTDDNRETVTLSIPAWIHARISDTSGT